MNYVHTRQSVIRLAKPDNAGRGGERPLQRVPVFADARAGECRRSLSARRPRSSGSMYEDAAQWDCDSEPLEIGMEVLLLGRSLVHSLVLSHC